MKSVEDQKTYSKELYLVVGATVSAVGTIIGLANDIPQLGDSIVGKVVLYIILLVAIGYLAYFFYTRLINSYLELRNRLQEIKDILVNFTSNHANSALAGTVNIDLIKLISTTKWAKRLPLKIRELQYLPNNKVSITIDKGNNDGLLDSMQFKVLHISRLHEIGSCACTTFHDQTTLVITVDPACPIPLSEIKRDTVEVRLIEPEIKNEDKVALLIADLLYKIDYG